jgi:hypothetical protein
MRLVETRSIVLATLGIVFFGLHAYGNCFPKESCSEVYLRVIDCKPVSIPDALLEDLSPQADRPRIKSRLEKSGVIVRGVITRSRNKSCHAHDEGSDRPWKIGNDNVPKDYLHYSNPVHGCEAFNIGSQVHSSVLPTCCDFAGSIQCVLRLDEIQVFQVAQDSTSIEGRK